MIVCRSPFVAEGEKEQIIIVHGEIEKKKEATATERMREREKRSNGGERKN